MNFTLKDGIIRYLVFFLGINAVEFVYLVLFGDETNTFIELFLKIIELVVAFVVFQLYEKKVFQQLFGLHLKIKNYVALFFITISYSMAMSYTLVTLFSQDYVDKSLGDYFEIIHPNITTTVSDLILLFITLSILVPIVEELVFRALLYKALKTRLPMFLAIIISAAFFSLNHSLNNIIFIHTFIFAIMQCLLYERYKNIKAIIFSHAVLNGTSVSLMALSTFMPYFK